MSSRRSKTITSPKDIEYLVNLTEQDITTSFVMECFGEFSTGQRFRSYDIIEIPVNSYGPKNKRNKK